MMPAKPRSAVKRLRAPAVVETVDERARQQGYHAKFLERTDEFCAIPHSDDVGSVEDVEPDEKGDDEDADCVNQ
jgi:hypothetical protein